MTETQANQLLARIIFGETRASQLIVGLGSRHRPLGPVLTAANEYGRGLAEADEDPISYHYGFFPPGPSPEQVEAQLDAIAREHGWADWKTVRAEAEKATNYRWVHFNLTF